MNHACALMPWSGGTCSRADNDSSSRLRRAGDLPSEDPVFWSRLPEGFNRAQPRLGLLQPTHPDRCLGFAPDRVGVCTWQCAPARECTKGGRAKNITAEPRRMAGRFAVRLATRRRGREPRRLVIADNSIQAQPAPRSRAGWLADAGWCACELWLVCERMVDLTWHALLARPASGFRRVQELLSPTFAHEVEVDLVLARRDFGELLDEPDATVLAGNSPSNDT